MRRNKYNPYNLTPPILEDKYRQFEIQSMRRHKIFAGCIVLIAIVAAVIFAVSYNSFIKNRTMTSQHNGHAEYAKKEIQYVMPVKTGDIIFIGTSLTEGFPVYELFPGLPVRNRGIAGNRIIDIKHRMYLILQGTCPSKIFIEAGVNDLLTHNIPEFSIVYYSDIIEYIKIKSPHTKIYIQSVFPVCYEYKFNPQVVQLNKMIKAMCDRYCVTYIDVYARLLSDRSGVLDTNYTYDGIHMKIGGIMRWYKCIDSFVKN